MKYFSMFTGIGGFELGIQRALPHADCIGYSEIDKYSIQTYEKHFGGVKNYGDATKINPSELPDFDFLCGGFPCQAFSIAGKRKGFRDTRGTLFFDIARILKVKRPKFILLENVKGLLNHEKGKTFSVIIQTLEELGYRTQWMVLNSKFFGVPQNRERVFIIGSLGGERRPEILPFRKDATEIQGTYGEERPQMIGFVEQICKKRRFETPKEINQFLKDHKGSFNIRKIAEKLNEPKTKVEHYFRIDKARAIPSPELWLKLKDLLFFDNTFDKQVLELYEKEIEFEQTRRVYSEQAPAPTINATQEPLVYKLHRATEIRESKISPTLSQAMGTGGHNVPMIVAQRGRNPVKPSDRTPGNYVEQRFEPNLQGTSNTLSSVQKDNLIWDGQNNYVRKDGLCGTLQGEAQSKQTYGFSVLNSGILRRLTPLECERLQGYPDDWTKGVSDTQRYKQLGNAVTVNVIEAIIRKYFQSFPAASHD